MRLPRLPTSGDRPGEEPEYQGLTDVARSFAALAQSEVAIVERGVHC